MRFNVLVLSLLLGGASSSVAQVQKPAPTQSHVLAIEELLHLLGADSLHKTLPSAFVPLTEADPAFADVTRALEELYTKYLKWQDIKAEFVAAYAETFSEQETRQLILFYRTPLGGKLQATEHALEAKKMHIVQRRLEPHMDEIMSAIAKRIPQRH